MGDAQGLLGLFLDWREILLAYCLGLLGGMARCAKDFADGLNIFSLKGSEYARKTGKLFLSGFSGFCFYLLTAEWTAGVHWKVLAIMLSGWAGAAAVELLIETGRLMLQRWAGAAQVPKDPPADGPMAP